MKDSIRAKLIKKLLKLTRWQRRALLVFACVVVGLTTYALMMPAVTLESEYLCGKEAHIHGPGCYETDPDSGELKLICTREEHIHDERCLFHEPNPEKYICGHDYEHTHGVNCYRDGVLVCTLVEHTHTDDCLSLAYLCGASAGAASEEDETPDASVSGGSEETPALPELEELSAEDSEAEGALSDAAEQGDAGEDAELSEPAKFLMRAATIDEADTDSSDEALTKGEPAEEDKEDEPEDKTEKGDAEAEEDSEGYDDGLEELYALIEAAKSGGLRAAPEYNLLDLPPDITFTIYKGSSPNYIYYNQIKNSNVINTSMVSGSGYRFILDMPTYANGLPKGMTYYYDLDCGGCLLYMTQGTDLVPIEKYYKNDTDIGQGTMLRVVRNDNGTYRFYVHNDSAKITFFNITGTLGGSTEPAKLKVQKFADWDASKLAYKYTVATTIPRAVDNFSQYYYLTDTTEVNSVNAKASQTDVYPGFLKNAENGTFSVTLGGNPIYTLSAAGPGDNFCYYLHPETGNMYLFNRFDADTHTHEVSVDFLPDGVMDTALSKGFCMCWQQLENLQLVVVYDDIYGRPYVLNNEYMNTVQIIDQDGKKDTGGVKGENRNNLLLKEYTGSENTFTITFNSEENPNDGPGDLGTTTDLIIRDEMQNAMLLSDQDPEVYRDSISDANLMTKGVNYTISISSTRDSFEVTIPQPGKHVYLIQYKVTQDENVTDKTILNTASVCFSGDQAFAVQRETTPEFDSSSSGGTGGAIFFYVRLKKQYEQNNPLKGASFGVFKAANDEMVLESVVTTNGNEMIREVKEYVYGFFPDTEPVTYTPGDTLDLVSFNANFLELDTVYYITETEAPDNYELSTKRYYFYVTESPSPVSLPDGNYDKGNVVVLNTWTNTPEGPRIDYTFEETLYNPKYRYDFPETGSSAGLLLRTVGIVLILSPALLLINRKRVKRS